MFQLAPLAESATFLIYISNHEPQHALLDPVLVPSFAVAIAPSCLYSVRRRYALTTKHASNSSTDHGGGRRRVVICGFAAKPSAVRNRRLCLVPHTRRVEPCQMCTRQHWVSDQHRSGTPCSDCGQAHALAGTSPTYFRVPAVILEIDIGELLPAMVAHDKGRANVLDRPRRPEAAFRQRH
jgi:hypothetical protein